MYVLWHGVTLIPWPPQEPTRLRFPVWLGIPKPMIPYPLLWEGAVRTVGSHLGRIPNCSEVPDTPPPGNRPPRRPSHTPPPSQNPPLLEPPPPRTPPPPPRGLRPTVTWGGIWRPEPRGHPPVAGPFVLCKGGCWCRRRRNTNFGPESFFHEPPPPPPRMCSQNVRHNVGTILSHICWGRPPPPAPPPTARQVG